MKKILSILLFIGVFFVGATNVNAVLMDDFHIFGTFEIVWHDYDDKLGYRPDEITLTYSDRINVLHDYEVTFNKDEVDVTRVDDRTTIWSVTIPGIYTDRIEGTEIYYTGGVPDHYSVDDTDYLTKEDKTSTIEFYILPFKTITYTEHWDDGNARDTDRYSAVGMTGDDNRYYRLSCANEKDTYIDKDTCQKEIYLEYAYHTDENGNHLLDSPIQFEYEMVDYFINYDYDIQVDEDGNIDVYIKHEPYRIDDANVTINWNDNDNKNKRRPNELTLDLYNKDVKEQSITISENDDWSKVITNLYKDYASGNPSEYRLEVSNTKDYEFNITGNNTDGYVIDAKYIGEDIVVNDISNDTNNINDTSNQSNVNGEKTSNPDTSDSIMIVISLLIISFMGIGLSLYKIKKK